MSDSNLTDRTDRADLAVAPVRMRVCDYIAKRLHDHGVRHVFGITGGGAAGLNDGFAKHGGFQWIGNHHEQASAFAAMGLAKVTGKLAVVNPTTGCGGTNCITGVLDAWQDSVPVLFVSGNVNRAQMTYGRRGVRKHGVQEADIIPLVETITKYSQVITKPEQIFEELEKAIDIATNGRPGPVWLDIPTDVQTAEVVVPAEVRRFNHDGNHIHYFRQALAAADTVKELLLNAKRPLVLLGAGARGDREHVEILLQRALPFVCTFGAIDLFPADHPQYVGRVGVKGDRAGNFAVHCCDLLIVLGASLQTAQTGYNLDHFAPNARVIWVDIEPQERQCEPGLADVYIETDIVSFVGAMVSEHRWAAPAWSALCRKWREQWPVCLPQYRDAAWQKEGINLYAFVDALSAALPDNAAVVSDAGSAIYVPCQGLKLRDGQRHIISLAQADMGWALPAAIGVALTGRPTIVVTGDGSFQTNLQELATIRALNLPIKIFVWNNFGYLSIRATQKKLFEGRLMGTDERHGLWFPQLQSLAVTYGFKYDWLGKTGDLDYLPTILARNGPTLVEVICPPDQAIVPTIGASRDPEGRIQARPLWDMAPYLPREELEAELSAAFAI